MLVTMKIIQKSIQFSCQNSEKKTFNKILEKNLYFLLARVLNVPRIAQPVQHEQPKSTPKTIFPNECPFLCGVMKVNE